MFYNIFQKLTFLPYKILFIFLSIYSIYISMCINSSIYQPWSPLFIYFLYRSYGWFILVLYIYTYFFRKLLLFLFVGRVVSQGCTFDDRYKLQEKISENRGPIDIQNIFGIFFHSYLESCYQMSMFVQPNLA